MVGKATSRKARLATADSDHYLLQGIEESFVPSLWGQSARPHMKTKFPSQKCQAEQALLVNFH